MAMDNTGGTLPTVGGSNNTWGAILNTLLELVDDFLGDSETVATTGGDTALSSGQHQNSRLNVSGTLVSNATLTFDGRGGKWIISNNTTGAFTVTCRIGVLTGVVVPQGTSRIVFFNGTDMKLVGATVDDEPLTSLGALSIVAGDLVYGSATDTLARLPKGTNGQLLSLVLGIPAWVDAEEGGSFAVNSQVFFWSWLLEEPENGDYDVIVNSPYACTINSVTTDCESGTATLTGKINTTALGGTANSVSTSESTQTHVTANALVAGDNFRLTLASVSSAVKISVTVKITRTLA